VGKLVTGEADPGHASGRRESSGRPKGAVGHYQRTDAGSKKTGGGRQHPAKRERARAQSGSAWQPEHVSKNVSRPNSRLAPRVKRFKIRTPGLWQNPVRVWRAATATAPVQVTRSARDILRKDESEPCNSQNREKRKIKARNTVQGDVANGPGRQTGGGGPHNKCVLGSGIKRVTRSIARGVCLRWRWRRILVTR